jgi:hypothetical protein
MTWRLRKRPSNMRDQSLVRFALFSTLVALQISTACSLRNENDFSSLPDTAILSSDRKVEWGRAGVWKEGQRGIPSYPVGITVNTTNTSHQYYCDPTGATDCRSKLQAALNACPAGQAVFLPAGTYRISSTLTMPSNVALRGAGPTRTTIRNYNNGEAIAMNGASGSQTATNISSGATKGSQSVVVANASAFSVGSLVLIDQLNDPSFVTRTGAEGTCSWCGRDNGNRALGEINRVVSKSGNTIGLDRPLAYGYNASYTPQMCLMSGSPVVYAGVEDLAITPSSSSFSSSVGVLMQWAYSCWVRNTNIYGQAHKGVWIFAYCMGCEVRDSYIHDLVQFDGDRGYPVNIQNQSSWNLVENNIMKMSHNGVILGSSGGAANVVAYNFIYNTKHYATYWFMHAIGAHGAHTYMNLFEGNIIPKLNFDYTWGSGSHHVCLRNQVTDRNPEVNVTNNLSGVDVEAWQYAMSFIGNVLGHPGYNGAYENTSPEEYSLWSISNHSVTRSALIRHGNYDYATQSVRWDSNISDRTIPESLYLDSRPGWFGGLEWPAIGPDVTGYVKNTPASLRWQTYLSSGSLADLFPD